MNVSSLTIVDSIRNPCIPPFCLGQGVEYNTLSILRIYAKYNPVAHNAQAAQLKQYGSQFLNHEKRWPAIASIILTYPNWCGARIHQFPSIFFMACKMYYPFLYLISHCILFWTRTRCILSKFTSLGSVSGTSYRMMALLVICIGDW